MILLAHLIAWLNAVANVLFGLLRTPMTVLPAWLSLTLISAGVGVVLLIVFKHTSNQVAIGKVRDAIKANLLAMKLFKDNIPVVLKSQAKIILNAMLLLVHSLRPMLVMIIPFTIILAQLGLWYQFRPLAVGEQAVVTMQLTGSPDDPMPPVALVPSPAAIVTVGPVHVPSKRKVFWQIQAEEAGEHALTFQVDNQQVQKELTVGDGLMLVSAARPALSSVGIFLNPAEKPFAASSPVHSISIDYPDRASKLTGTDTWVISLFVISMIVAFICKPFFNVKL